MKIMKENIFLNRVVFNIFEERIKNQGIDSDLLLSHEEYATCLRNYLIWDLFGD